MAWYAVVDQLNRPLLQDEAVQIEWLAWLAQIGPMGSKLVPVELTTGDLGPLERIAVSPSESQTWRRVLDTTNGTRNVSFQVEGRVDVEVKGRLVPSGPDGVTIEYRHEHPLGALLVAVVPKQLEGRISNPFSTAELVGPESQREVSEGAQLFLSINQFSQEKSPGGAAFEVRVKD